MIEILLDLFGSALRIREEAQKNALLTEAAALARLRTVLTIALSRTDTALAAVAAAEATTDAAVAAGKPK